MNFGMKVYLEMKNELPPGLLSAISNEGGVYLKRLPTDDERHTIEACIRRNDAVPSFFIGSLDQHLTLEAYQAVYPSGETSIGDAPGFDEARNVKRGSSTATDQRVMNLGERLSFPTQRELDLCFEPLINEEIKALQPNDVVWVDVETLKQVGVTYDCQGQPTRLLMQIGEIIVHTEEMIKIELTAPSVKIQWPVFLSEMQRPQTFLARPTEALAATINTTALSSVSVVDRRTFREAAATAKEARSRAKRGEIDTETAIQQGFDAMMAWTEGMERRNSAKRDAR
jgi:hypothetical protein